jgi:hypothetical protein
MDFKQTCKVCLDFAIANNATIGTYTERDTKLAILSRTDCSKMIVELDQHGFAQVTCFQGESKESFYYSPVNSEERLLETLTKAWVKTTLNNTPINNTAIYDTPIHAIASLLDAKLADVHAAIEKNTELLQRILSGKISISNVPE